MPYNWASSNLGLKADSVQEVLEWITTNSNGYTFCFPPTSMGPDILFFLQSEPSGELLLVALQAKRYKEVETRELAYGVKSVTPDYFWKSKQIKEEAIQKSAYIVEGTEQPTADLFMKALKKIPLAVKIPNADYPILRIFASAPGDANLERTVPRSSLRGKVKNFLAQQNPDKHPIASLDIKKLNEVEERFTYQWLKGVTQASLLAREH